MGIPRAPQSLPRPSFSSQRKRLPPYKGQGWQALPLSGGHPYCVQGTKPDPRKVTRAILLLGTHWVFIFSTQTNLLRKIRETLKGIRTRVGSLDS